jgi:hypothetical protein
MTRGPGPYDPQSRPPRPNPDPVLPGHSPTEVSVRPPAEAPTTVPSQAPISPMTPVEPGGQPNPRPFA